MSNLSEADEGKKMLTTPASRLTMRLNSFIQSVRGRSGDLRQTRQLEAADANNAAPFSVRPLSHINQGRVVR